MSNGVTTATFAEQYLDRAIIEVNELMSGNGTEKYGGGLAERPISEQLKSLQNHIGRYKAGLDRDVESGALHLTAVAAQALIALQHYLTKPRLDDRPKRLMSHSEMYKFMEKGGPVVAG